MPISDDQRNSNGVVAQDAAGVLFDAQQAAVEAKARARTRKKLRRQSSQPALFSEESTGQKISKIGPPVKASTPKKVLNADHDLGGSTESLNSSNDYSTIAVDSDLDISAISVYQEDTQGDNGAGKRDLDSTTIDATPMKETKKTFKQLESFQDFFQQHSRTGIGSEELLGHFAQQYLQLEPTLFSESEEIQTEKNIVFSGNAMEDVALVQEADISDVSIRSSLLSHYNNEIRLLFDKIADIKQEDKISHAGMASFILKRLLAYFPDEPESHDLVALIKLKSWVLAQYMDTFSQKPHEQQTREELQEQVAVLKEKLNKQQLEHKATEEALDRHVDDIKTLNRSHEVSLAEAHQHASRVQSEYQGYLSASMAKMAAFSKENKALQEKLSHLLKDSDRIADEADEELENFEAERNREVQSLRKQIKSLETKISNAAESLDGMQTDLEQATEELTSKAATIKTQETTLSTAQDNVVALQSEIELLSESLAFAQNQRDLLQDEVTTLRERQAQLDAEMAEANNGVDSSLLEELKAAISRSGDSSDSEADLQDELDTTANDLREKEAEVAALETALQDLETKNAELSEQLQQRAAELDAARNAHESIEDQLNQKIAELQGALQRAEAASATLEGSVEALRQALDSQKADAAAKIQALESDNVKTKEALQGAQENMAAIQSELQGRISELNTLVEETQNDLQVSEAQVVVLTDQLDAAQTKAAQDSEVAKERIAALEQKAQTDQATILEKGSEIGNLKKVVEDAQTRMQTLDEKIAGQVQTIEAAESALEKANDSNAEKTDEINVLKASLTDLESEKDAVQTQLESGQQEISALSAEIIQLRNAVEEVASEKAALSAQVSNLEDDKNRLTDKVTDLQGELEATAQKVSAKQAENTQLSEEIDTLDSQIQENKAIIENLQHEKDNYKSMLSTLNTQIEALEATISDTEDDLKNAKGENALQAVQISEQAETLQRLIQERAVLEEQISHKDSEIGAEKSTLVDLTKRLGELESKNSELLSQLDLLTKNLQDKNTELSALKEKLESKIVSLVGELKNKSQALSTAQEDKNSLETRLTGEIQALKTNLRSLKDAKALADKKIRKLEKSKANQIAQLSSELDALQQNLQKNDDLSAEEIAQLTNEIRALQGALLNQEVDALSESMALKASLRTAQKEAAEALQKQQDRTVGIFADGFARNVLESGKAEALLEKSQEEVQTLRAVLRSDMALAKKELEAERQKLNKSEENEAKAKSQLAQLQAALDVLQEKYDASDESAQQKISRLEQKIGLLKSAVAEAEQFKIEKAKNDQAARQEIAKLQEEVVAEKESLLSSLLDAESDATGRVLALEEAILAAQDSRQTRENIGYAHSDAGADADVSGDESSFEGNTSEEYDSTGFDLGEIKQKLNDLRKKYPNVQKSQPDSNSSDSGNASGSLEENSAENSDLSKAGIQNIVANSGPAFYEKFAGESGFELGIRKLESENSSPLNSMQESTINFDSFKENEENFSVTAELTATESGSVIANSTVTQTKPIFANGQLTNNIQWGSTQSVPKDFSSEDALIESYKTQYLAIALAMYHAGNNAKGDFKLDLNGVTVDDQHTHQINQAKKGCQRAFKLIYGQQCHFLNAPEEKAEDNNTVRRKVTLSTNSHSTNSQGFFAAGLDKNVSSAATADVEMDADRIPETPAA